MEKSQVKARHTVLSENHKVLLEQSPCQLRQRAARGAERDCRPRCPEGVLTKDHSTRPPGLINHLLREVDSRTCIKESLEP